MIMCCGMSVKRMLMLNEGDGGKEYYDGDSDTFW